MHKLVGSVVFRLLSQHRGTILISECAQWIPDIRTHIWFDSPAPLSPFPCLFPLSRLSLSLALIIFSPLIKIFPFYVILGFNIESKNRNPYHTFQIDLIFSYNSQRLGVQLRDFIERKAPKIALDYF